MLKLLQTHWAFLLVILSIIIFFSRLFFPQPSVFTTPDFGRSDMLHKVLPQFFIQSESTRHLRIPFWDNTTGYGYPALGESVGFFFIPNLILLFLLPFQWAAPSIFLATFLICAISMYFLLRNLNFNKGPSAIGALAFTFSAAMILRFPHIAIAQSLSITPLAFAINLKIIENFNKKNAILLAIILSQILMTFAQMFVYLVLLLSIFNMILLTCSKNKNGLVSFFLKFALLLIFSLILSSAQLIPSYSALKLSQRSGGVNPSSILNDFPLSFKNLLAFSNPFIVGKASNGTYNYPDWSQHGIYWENTGYIGLLPLLFGIFAIIVMIRAKRINKYSATAIVAFISLMLALGNQAPLHILFSAPPLSFFRVPARFLLFTQFFIAILAAYGIQTFILKRSKGMQNLLITVILLVTIFDFYKYWWNYHPTESVKSVTQKPEILANIDQANLEDYRVYSVGSLKQWNEIFTKSGWENNEEKYKFFRNALEPNTNAFYKINHFSSYQILPSRRQNLQQILIPTFSMVTNNEMELSDTANKIMDLYSIKYLVTTMPIKNSHLEKVRELEKDGYKIILYQNPSAGKLINFYYDYQSISYIKDYPETLQKIDTLKTVVLEESLDKKLEPGENQITLHKNTPTSYDLSVFTSKEGILTLGDSYSKDWKAKIDGKSVKIFPANINSKALLIPQGTHHVEIYYQSILIIVGILISIFAYLACIKILLKRS